ncbi:hypothetical protein V5799_014249 [Amblyomma americanum]|uniref:Adenylate cyclase n=1 Tax=Amblyomma americanum TaxID=6943 RepID=A0AAQ4E3L1_AMBAM
MNPAPQSRLHSHFRASDFVLEFFAFLYIFAHSSSTSVHQLLLRISECIYRGSVLPEDVNSTFPTPATTADQDRLDRCAASMANRSTRAEEVPLEDVMLSLPVIELACSLVICMVVGGWSDAHGRKLHFVLALLGALIKDLAALVFVLAKLPGRDVIYGVTIASGLLGSANLFAAGALCHVSDNSDYRSRTARIGGLTFALYVGRSASVFVERTWKPLLVDSFARTTVIVVSVQLVLNLVCLLAVTVVVRESMRIMPGYSGSPVRNFVCMRQLKGVVLLATRKRNTRGREFVLILCAVFLLARFVYCGEQGVWAEYLFRRFSWTHQASLMLGLQYVCEAVFTLLAACLAQRLGFQDSSLAIAGAISFMGASAVKAVALTGGTHGIAVIVGALSPLMAVPVLALLSKLVQPEEIGCLFANVAVLSIAAPMLANVAYWEVFSATKAKVTEFIYLLSIFGGTLVCLLLVYIRRNLRIGSLGNLIQEEKVPLLRSFERGFGAAIM